MKFTFCFRFIVILLICLGFNSYAFCQESYIKGRWNIKSGYSQYSLGSWSNNEELMTGHYRLETNYGFFDAIETGVYFGYSEIDTDDYSKTYPTYFYGLNLNVHPLTYFLEFKEPMVDLYFTGKYGGRYYSGNHGEYSIGGGIAGYIGHYFGIYLEYTYGNHGAFYDNHMKLRYGLSIKF